MALTEKTEIKVEVTKTEHLQVRYERVIMDDGVELARTYTREVVAPGQDVTGLKGKIRRIAAAAHVPTVVDRHQALEQKQLKKAELDLAKQDRAQDDTPENQAAEAAAEQALLDAEAAHEAAEAAHEAFLISEDG